MKLNSPRVLVLIALAALAVAALVWMMMPASIPVDTGKITSGPLEVWLEEPGRTRVREVYIVSAPLTGKTARITLHAGDVVAAGQTVAFIRPLDPPLIDVRSRAEMQAAVSAADAAVRLAQADLARTQAQATFAAAEWTRGQTLAERGVISAQALDQRKLARDTANAAVATARAAVTVRLRERDSARSRLADPLDGARAPTPLRSPASGSVLRVLRESEQAVQAGEPIIQIGDPRDIDVIVELLSSDAVVVRPGAAARIEGWGGSPLTARVRRVEPSGFTKVSALGVEEQRVLVYLDFVDPRQAAQLGHDYRVTARIITSSTPRTLRVPASALFRQDDDWAVYGIVNGRAQLRTVRIGRRNEDFAEVLSGLTEGEAVVTYPGDRLADGVRVTLRRIE